MWGRRQLVMASQHAPACGDEAACNLTEPAASQRHGQLACLQASHCLAAGVDACNLLCQYAYPSASISMCRISLISRGGARRRRNGRA